MDYYYWLLLKFIAISIKFKPLIVRNITYGAGAVSSIGYVSRYVESGIELFGDLCVEIIARHGLNRMVAVYCSIILGYNFPALLS